MLEGAERTLVLNGAIYQKGMTWPDTGGRSTGSNETAYFYPPLKQGDRLVSVTVYLNNNATSGDTNLLTVTVEKKAFRAVDWVSPALATQAYAGTGQGAIEPTLSVGETLVAEYELRITVTVNRTTGTFAYLHSPKLNVIFNYA